MNNTLGIVAFLIFKNISTWFLMKMYYLIYCIFSVYCHIFTAVVMLC